MVRIFLEDNELDVYDNFSHQITYAVDDIKNLDSKSTAYSKTIIIPGTSKNNALFGNIFEIHNANFTVDGAKNIGYNFNATKSAKVVLQANEIQIVKGVLRLMEVIIDGSLIEYEVAIFGELGGFYSKLGGKKLEDIDLSIYNHTYNYTNISNSWNYAYTYTGAMDFINNTLFIFDIKNFNLDVGQSFTIGSAGGNNGTYTITSYAYYGNKATITISSNWTSQANYLAATITFNPSGYAYYYPLIDYGNVSTDKIDYDVKALRPAVYVKELMDRIITNAGYTWESIFFNSTLFESLIIPNNQKTFEVLKTRLFTGFTQSFSGTISNSGISLTNSAAFVNMTTADNINYTYTGTTNNFNINYNVTFNTLKTSNNPFNFDLGFKIVVYKTRGATTSVEYISPNYTYYNYKGIGSGIFYSANVDINFTFTASGINLQNNDILFFQIVSDLTTGLSGSSTQANTLITIDSSVPIMLPVSIGDTVQLNNCMPQNILQKDFFTTIMKMFNLMVTEDKLVEKKLIIEPYIDFYQTDPSTYLDWSYKIDRSSPIRIKPMSEANARVYKLTYKDDSDYHNELYKKKYNENYSSIMYDNLLEFSKETSSVEILFSSTPIVGYTGKDKKVSTIYKLNGTTEDSTASVIRILQKKNITVGAYKLYNPLSSSTLYVSGITTFPYAGHLDSPNSPTIDISFGAPKEVYFTTTTYPSNNLFNTYYSPYIAEITDKDSRLVTMKIKLTEVDIYNLDFSRLIYVDGVLYRLQKIIDYSVGELCTIELLRVINVIY